MIWFFKICDVTSFAPQIFKFATSVIRLGDLLDFGQLFIAFSNN